MVNFLSSSAEGTASVWHPARDFFSYWPSSSDCNTSGVKREARDEYWDEHTAPEDEEEEEDEGVNEL